MAQIKAFEGTCSWDEGAAKEYDEVLNSGHDRVARALKGLHDFLGGSDMLAYLSMMALRLIELRRVLKPTGSIYLHCDCTANAYLRVLMDAVFGPANFRNEVIWYYYNKMHDRRKKLFPGANDTILFYVKDVRADFTYKQLKELRDVPVKQLLRKKVDGRMVNAKDEDGHVQYRMKEDRTLDNVWRIPCLQPAAQERLGYQTQKPQRLLERIVEASSNEGDTVLDPFCGCGTTIAAAQKLNRRWIGIDITHLSINLIKVRLADAFGSKIADTYKVIGEPTDLESAKALAEQDKYQFQYWALGFVGARPAQSDERKGADKGIDGRLYMTDRNDVTASVIISVKGGHVTASQVRDLRGVIEREEAATSGGACSSPLNPPPHRCARKRPKRACGRPRACRRRVIHGCRFSRLKNCLRAGGSTCHCSRTSAVSNKRRV